MVKNLTTSLQIELSVPLKDSEELIGAFYDIAVTSSYAELLLFKKLAANADTADRCPE